VVADSNETMKEGHHEVFKIEKRPPWFLLDAVERLPPSFSSNLSSNAHKVIIGPRSPVAKMLMLIVV
ncbi:hypothetical protein ACHAXA_001573, partial [Cyclostephanos tholiformis]